MTVDLVIRNGRVVTPAGVIGGGVAIGGERIVAVGADATLPPSRRTIDAREQYVLPGLVDAHVHMGSEEDTSIADGLAQNHSRGHRWSRTRGDGDALPLDPNRRTL